MKQILSGIFIWFAVLASSDAQELVDDAASMDVVSQSITSSEEPLSETVVKTARIEEKAAPVEVIANGISRYCC